MFKVQANSEGGDKDITLFKYSFNELGDGDSKKTQPGGDLHEDSPFVPATALGAEIHKVRVCGCLKQPRLRR